MAIANTSESESPIIILAVVHIPSESLIDVEQKIRQKELVILQKKQLDCNVEEIKPWFKGNIDDSSESETTGYVLQGEEVTTAWQDIAAEFGPDKCGVANNDDLQRFFPGIVLDKYLLQPEWASMFLSQLRPILMAGLQNLCDEKPEDPLDFLCNYLESERNKMQS